MPISFSKPQALGREVASDALERFDCGVPALNGWLRRRALQNERCGSSRTYVVLADDGSLAGYFCLSNAVIAHDRLSAAQRRNKPDPLPCCLLGRLAVDNRFKGMGLGAAMLVEGLKITKRVSEMSGCWALIVQPKGEGEAGFYEHLGFRRCRAGDAPLLFYETADFP